jgi:hypothetical protein
MPRWIKLSVLIGILVAVLVIVVLLVSGGHTPRRHGPSNEDGCTAPSSVVPSGHVHGW